MAEQAGPLVGRFETQLVARWAGLGDYLSAGVRGEGGGCLAWGRSYVEGTEQEVIVSP